MEHRFLLYRGKYTAHSAVRALLLQLREALSVRKLPREPNIAKWGICLRFYRDPEYDLGFIP